MKGTIGLYVLYFVLSTVLWFWLFSKSPSISDRTLSNKSDAVVIIPGLGGSILDGVWDRRAERYDLFCDAYEYEWTQMWPTAYSAIPLVNRCWADRFAVTISNDGKKYNSATGVYIKPRDFGGVGGISDLESFSIGLLDIPIVKYFEQTINVLRDLGYESISGAPYDFRRIIDVDYLSQYCLKLKKLIEDSAYVTSSKVSLISHSLGCPVTSYFLNSQSKAWRNMYISKFVSVSGPFGGSTKALEACLTGSTEGLPVEKQFIRSLEKKMAGVIWMINEPSCWKQEPIVNNFITKDLPEVLSAAGEIETATALKASSDAWKIALKDPQVPMYIVYGNGVKTLQKLDYQYDFNDPIGTYSAEGDGTVPLKSLTSPRLVHKWNIKEEISIPQASHLGILSNDEWYKILIKLFGTN